MKITPDPTHNVNHMEIEPGDRVALLDSTGTRRMTKIKTVPVSRAVLWNDIVVETPQTLMWGWFNEDDSLKALGGTSFANARTGDSVWLHADPYLPEPPQPRENPAPAPIHPLVTLLIVLGLSAVGWVIISGLFFTLKLLVGLF